MDFKNKLQYPQNHASKGPSIHSQYTMEKALQKHCPHMNGAALKTAQDIDNIIPDAIRACLGAKKQPYSMLQDLYESAQQMPNNKDGEIQRIIVSYGALLALFPGELFGVSGARKGELLVNGLISGQLVNREYIESLLLYEEDGGSILPAAISVITGNLSQTDITLVHQSLSVVSLIASLHKCLDILLADGMQSLLVAIASASTLKLDAAATSGAAYQRSYDHLVAALYSLTMRCLKTNRARTVHVLLGVTNQNKDRLKMQFDADRVCSDSASIVFLGLMLQLSEPFMSMGIRDGKEPLIDTDYYARFKGRLDISGLNTIIDTSEPGAKDEERKTDPNFISDCFYMCLHWMKAAISRMIDDYYELSRVLSEVDAALANPAMNAFIRAKLAADKVRLGAAKTFIEAFVFYEPLQTQCMSFVHLLMHHLLRVYHSPDSRYTYAQLPEFYLEVISEQWLFLSRTQPQRWLQLPEPLDLFLAYAVFLMRNPQSCRNIYLRAKMIEVLHGWILPGSQPNTYPLARLFQCSYTSPVEPSSSVRLSSVLIPLLINLYIDVEQTGASSQFYEKFNFRFHIASILIVLCDDQHSFNVEYRLAMQAQTKRPESFLRFQNLLLNDCTYLLDESLSKLADLHKKEQSGNSTDDVSQIERQLTSYMQLTNADLSLLSLLTRDMAEPFTRPEIVSRLAAMLLVNLKQLVGDRCRQLKVKNPAQYHFDPRFLLGILTRIFLHMSAQPSFCHSVRSDHRSFESSFLQADLIQVLERTSALSPALIAEFSHAATSISQLPLAPHESSLADVPDEFLDPLMFTLMRDPVVLKTSNMTVDRATIRAHLLNDQHDPFNRMPLSEADLEADSGLKARIDTWLSAHSGEQ